MNMSVYDDALALHQQHQGKIGTALRVTIKDRADLSLVYTPGVAEVSRLIAKDEQASFTHTMRGRTVAVVSDGSAVLGLGNIGAAAAMPVMEGKAALFKQFGDVDAVPLCIDLHTTEEIVTFVKAIVPSYAGVNLEDIAAPRCLEIEDQLQDIGIPVFHDDQHGTAIVVSAAVRNAAKVVGKPYASLKVVISGAGAAGLAVAQMLLGLDRKDLSYMQVEGTDHVADVVLVDSKGIVSKDRADLDHYKREILKFSNLENKSGSLADAMQKADVFIGVSRAGLVKPEMVQAMAKDAIVLALQAGAAIAGTGRSDFANQVNNSLVFPGFFKGMLRAKAKRVSVLMKQAASQALADFTVPTKEAVLPTMFDAGVADAVANAVAAQAQKEGDVR
jgi:malate dehydrogenase (oxaloacetate-decarboxylating)